MSDKTTHLKISTPKGVFFDGDVDIVTLKTANGYIGIQKNRLPFISNIEISTMYINSVASNNQKICAIGGGLIYVEREYIDIFTDDIIQFLAGKDNIVADALSQLEIHAVVDIPTLEFEVMAVAQDNDLFSNSSISAGTSKLKRR